MDFGRLKVPFSHFNNKIALLKTVQVNFVVNTLLYQYCVYYEIYLHSLYNVFSFNMVPKIRVKGGVPVIEIGAAPTWVLSPSNIKAYFLKMKINKQIAV